MGDFVSYSVPLASDGRLDVAALVDICVRQADENLADLGTDLHVMRTAAVPLEPLPALGDGPAVYLFLGAPGTKMEHRPLKVGMTGNITRRLREHLDGSGLAAALRYNPPLWPVLGAVLPDPTAGAAREWLTENTYLAVVHLDGQQDTDVLTRALRDLEMMLRAHLGSVFEGVGAEVKSPIPDMDDIERMVRKERG